MTCCDLGRKWTNLSGYQPYVWTGLETFEWEASSFNLRPSFPNRFDPFTSVPWEAWSWTARSGQSIPSGAREVVCGGGPVGSLSRDSLWLDIWQMMLLRLHVLILVVYSENNCPQSRSFPCRLEAWCAEVRLTFFMFAVRTFLNCRCANVSENFTDYPIKPLTILFQILNFPIDSQEYAYAVL